MTVRHQSWGLYASDSRTRGGLDVHPWARFESREEAGRAAAQMNSDLYNRHRPGGGSNLTIGIKSYAEAPTLTLRKWLDGGQVKPEGWTKNSGR